MRFILLFVGAVWALAIGIYLLTAVKRYDFHDLRPLPKNLTAYEKCISGVTSGDEPGWNACFLKSYNACRGDGYVPCLRTFSKAARRFVDSRNDGGSEYQALIDDIENRERNCRDRFTGMPRAQCLAILAGGASFAVLEIDT